MSEGDSQRLPACVHENAVAGETGCGAGQAEKRKVMSQDTLDLIEAFVRDYAGERETQFRGRLAEILSQCGAEIEQRELFGRAA